jgi:hypothetical protein
MGCRLVIGHFEGEMTRGERRACLSYALDGAALDTSSDARRSLALSG